MSTAGSVLAAKGRQRQWEGFDEGKVLLNLKIVIFDTKTPPHSQAAKLPAAYQSNHRNIQEECSDTFSLFVRVISEPSAIFLPWLCRLTL